MNESGHIDRRKALGLIAAGTTAAALPLTSDAATPSDPPLYRNAQAPIEDRVKDLLSRMTLEEKVGQMIAIWTSKSEMMEGLTFVPEKASKAYPAGFGQITRPSDRRGGPAAPASAGPAGRWRTPENTVKFINDAQRWAMNDTRLGIPLLFHEECLHGYMATDSTMFPQAIGLAGSFDTDLMRAVQSTIAREVRARGITYVLSPVVDIARDPRWGRIEETFGEDPFLVAEMGVAAVEGLQGPGKFEKLGPGKVFATLKHMTGHGQPESGENVGPAPVAERELRENFFPPFREIIRRTSIAAVMPSYNEIDGVPSHVNQWLLRKVLRTEWGFDGVIASDYNAIEELVSLHKVVDDLDAAARAALAAGVDAELPNGAGYRSLVAQVKAGKVPQRLVDEACARMLRLKFRSGLFESPYADFAHADRITGDADARALALRAAERSICLLKNDGTLPLTPGAHKRVAVIGPNAAITRLGGYSSVPRQSVTLLDGIRARLAGQAEVAFAQGVYITHNDDRSVDEIILADPIRNRSLIADAVEVARGADLVILAIGDTEQTVREGYARNHLGDRTSLDLVGEQNELFAALKALGKPVVVCAINGRPPTWPLVSQQANATLECWYVGQEGGTAIARTLFGDVNPGAKLPVTVVRDVGQIPYFYNHKPSARRGYLFDDKAALYPFGFGLSYTTFDLSAPTFAVTQISAGESLEVRVTARNTGSRTGDEVIQVYIRRNRASVTQPVLELKGFRRVTLQPGETRSVAITLDAQAFALWNDRMQEVIEPGKVDILVGPNSRDLKSASMTIV